MMGVACASIAESNAGIEFRWKCVPDQEQVIRLVEKIIEVFVTTVE